MLGDMLNLINAVTITRYSETSDGLGGITTSTSTTTLVKANIWTASSNDRTLSDKITKTSTHVLALEYGAYSFTVDDRTVGYNGHTYTLTGNFDNVAERNELILAGLKWQQ